MNKRRKRKKSKERMIFALFCGLTLICGCLLIGMLFFRSGEEAEDKTDEMSALEEMLTEEEKQEAETESETEVIKEAEEEPAEETEKQLEVHFIDIGQGDATLVKFGDQEMLIDTGSADPQARRSERDILVYLQENGVEKLEYLLLTHGHEDHMGRACDILQEIEVEKVICDFGNQEGYVQRLQQMLSDMEMEVIVPQAGQEYRIGDAVVHIVTGRVAQLDEVETETATEKVNNQSIGVKVLYKENSFLLYGDGEAAYEKYLLESGEDLAADVLKVPHHGAAVSCCQEILDAVQPEYAVISSAKQEDFGFPSGEVLLRMAVGQITTFYTNRQGNVIAISDGEHVSFTTRR